MLASLILAAALGQCAGGSCAVRPAYRPAPVYRVAPAPVYRVAPRPPYVAPQPYRTAPRTVAKAAPAKACTCTCPGCKRR